MALYVECGPAGMDVGDTTLPVASGPVEWSESVASGAASSLAVPGGGTFALTLTSGEDGYFALHRVAATAITLAGTAGSGGSARRRLIKAGVARDVYVPAGFFVAYSTT
jgi:hypothetical protein